VLKTVSIKKYIGARRFKMQCLCCKQEKQLIKAHILPKGLNNLYSNDKNFKEYDIPTGTIKTKQNTKFDQNILCKECDAKLGLYDSELILFIRKALSREEKRSCQFASIACNTENLYFGILASLWRSSISSRGQVKLLGLYSEELRKFFSDNCPLDTSPDIRVILIDKHEKDIQHVMVDDFLYHDNSTYCLYILGVAFFITFSDGAKETFRIDAIPEIRTQPNSVRCLTDQWISTSFYQFILNMIHIADNVPKK